MESGGDIILTWTGGTGPYSSSAALAQDDREYSVIASNVAGATLTHSGTAAAAVGLHAYIVSDIAAKPTLRGSEKRHRCQPGIRPPSTLALRV